MPKPKSKSRLTPEMEARKFKPGQSGNPNGRPPLNPIQRALKNLTIATYREVIELVMTGNVDAVKAMILDPKTPALQVGIAKAFANAITRGDYNVIEQIAQRIVGKIPDELNVNSNNRNANLNASIDPAKVKAAMKKLQEDV